ncbi:MAG: cobyrinate a,c-diamide synthase [Caldimicrobium sp.]
MALLSVPRVVISSHRGGAGKTIFTLLLISILKERGFQVAPFKKGPDYIDAGWLGRAAQKPCRNLDLFLFDAAHNLYSFYKGSQGCDVAIIEGNRGLFDGVDIEGSCSTESLAKLLKAPVILVLDCTKATRSMAALLKGFIEFDPDVQIKGVILNNVANPRHESIIRGSIEKYTEVSVLGVIPRLKEVVKERHLGLITYFEKDLNFLDSLKNKVVNNVDIDKIIEIAKSSPELHISENMEVIKKEFNLKIGVFLDSAFQFYYPENLESLLNLGAEPVFINSLEENKLPSELAGLYLGGGFPEIYAEKLAENEELRREIKYLVEAGMPVYAECGGLMFLGEEIEWQEKKFPMAGVLPLKFKISKKPYGHGYVIAKVINYNPYFKVGDTIKGHEFHYSYPYQMEIKKDMHLVFQLEKGVGLDGRFDGLSYKNLIACYTHIHVFSVKYWAKNFLKKAEEFLKS